MDYTSNATAAILKAQLATVRHDDKWELLKPILQPMFENLTATQIAQNVRELYGFDANEAAYRFRFKKWRWKKNFPAPVKEKAIRQIQKRAASGKPSQVTLAGQQLDVKRLRRHALSSIKRDSTIVSGSQRDAKSQAKSLGDFLPFGNRIFVNWNMPFGLKILLHNNSPFGLSPASMPDPSPSNIKVCTPADYKTPPADHHSPMDYVSPRSVAIKRRTAVDRADLFLRGKLDELVSSMNDAERVMASKWLYQFWHFGFVTSKYWGRGPRFWTAEDLQFDEYDAVSFTSTAVSPGRMDYSPAAEVGGLIHQIIPNPSMFCKYAIHIVHTRLDGYGEDDGDIQDTTGDNEEWPEESTQIPMQVRLCQALASNDFSNIPATTLPLAVNHIAHAAEKSPSELLGESLTFAIMARNLDLVNDLMVRAEEDGVDLASTYYLHVATSYLDGGSTCCMILENLCWLSPLPQLRAAYVNEHGHTVLDNLILTILKSHSKTPLDAVDDTLKRQPRFAGIEVDLCGRWDADDHCYRSLLQSGKTEIPFDWKHKFCHTSVQAVYHCIVSLHQAGLPLATESGIFVKYCTNPDCGRKLQLMPLHGLVLATFRLAQDGCDEEDLFGMSAILLCLVSCGLKAYETAHVSVPLLFGHGVDDECTHADITPFQLAQSLPQPIIASWDEMKQVGWRVFCQIMRRASDMQKRPSTVPNTIIHGAEEFPFTSVALVEPEEEYAGIEHYPGECTDPCFEGMEELCFEYSNDLGHLWAAFQAEILTHRKQTWDDPWTSERLNMKQLTLCLESDSKISIPLLDENMLAPYCRCGRFEEYSFRNPVLRGWATRTHFGNLDIWDRSTYLDIPPRLADMIYC